MLQSWGWNVSAQFNYGLTKWRYACALDEIVWMMTAGMNPIIYLTLNQCVHIGYR
jgi:hypothetical protein